MVQKKERQKVKNLFSDLCRQPMLPFPQNRKNLEVPLKPGVYVIRKGGVVLHVGRTIRGRGGLHQRLTNHLHGNSSFTNDYLHGEGDKLRKGHTYQSLVVKNPRLRALLEAYATGKLCPKHIGLGKTPKM